MPIWGDLCTWTRARLPLLAGEELAGPERRRAERHLITCPACRHRLDALRGTLQVLGQAAVAAPPDQPSLWPALARQIREERHLGGLDALPGRLIGLRAGLGLAFGLLLTLWGINAHHRPPAGPAPIRTSVPVATPVPLVVRRPPAAAPTPAPPRVALSPPAQAPLAAERPVVTQRAPAPVKATPVRHFDIDHGSPMPPNAYDAQQTH